jgi:tRNA threonylcarbamoyl adenosine modification protein YeaZ
MFLCIDTITSESGIALVRKGHADFIPIDSRHSSDGLFIALDALFAKAKVSVSDLLGVAVVKGPGSFTSVRVGIAVANQIAHQLKIPIVGLTTDEWYRLKTVSSDFLYLQSMNRDEVYAVGFGKLKPKIKTPIISFPDLPKEKKIVWLGQLSLEHQSSLPQGYQVAPDLKNTQDTWVSACEIFASLPKTQKAYDLVEPYYGKEPHITPSKRRFKVDKIQ